MGVDHESLTYFQSASVPLFHQRQDILRVEGEGFLAQYMLPRLESPATPFDMQMIRKGDIHRIKPGVLKKSFITAVVPRNPELPGYLPCRILVPGSHRRDSGKLVPLHPGDHRPGGYARCSQDSPSYSVLLHIKLLILQ